MTVAGAIVSFVYTPCSSNPIHVIAQQNYSYRCTCTATKHRAQIKSLQAGPIVLITEPAMRERPTAKRFRWRPGRARYCRRKESITVLLSGSTGLFCHCHMLYRRILTDCLSPAYKSQQQMTVSNNPGSSKAHTVETNIVVLH